jgi:signal transduction histidine kinase
MLSMDDAVAILGHEVRNLIATFVGFTELLMSHDWPREQQLEYLETMRNEGARVEQFLQDLLDLERFEAGAVSLKPRPTDLGDLLSCAATIAAHDPSHPVCLDYPPDLPPALAEPDRIQQVLANLLSNARKYTPKGGPIAISAHVVNNRLEVSVTDKGVGIPAEAMPRLFERFFRVDSHGHKGIRGTGLGLAVCRRIVEAHGGRIWAESDGSGQGARFTFSLPMVSVGLPSKATARAGARLSSRGEHIPMHQGDGRHPRSLPRPTTAQPPRGARASLLTRDRSPAH